MSKTLEWWAVRAADFALNGVKLVALVLVAAAFAAASSWAEWRRR